MASPPSGTIEAVGHRRRHPTKGPKSPLCEVAEWAVATVVRACAWSGLTVEERGHRAVLEDLLDGPADQRRDREDGELVEVAVGRDRQRVGDHDLRGRAVLQPVDRRV